jgi:uncharacterized protein YodC (DUF2158 family)
MALKVGDIVQLKSGGPKMTTVGSNLAYCSATTCWGRARGANVR